VSALANVAFAAGTNLLDLRNSFANKAIFSKIHSTNGIESLSITREKKRVLKLHSGDIRSRLRFARERKSKKLVSDGGQEEVMFGKVAKI
jgi:hypothetical protein